MEKTELILAHWPFIAALVVFMLVSEVLKTVFTKTAYRTMKPVWFFWWGRKTLPIHPVVAGVLTGLLWRNSEPAVDTLVECIGYFAMAGGLSVWAYEFLKAIAKKRGINLELPGVEDG